MGDMIIFEDFMAECIDWEEANKLAKHLGHLEYKGNEFSSDLVKYAILETAKSIYCVCIGG
ncbi:MAG: hypothetical protein HFE49_00615 [Clostridia bacterium]|nr:hypothetical protein [Clostridia bacterium]